MSPLAQPTARTRRSAATRDAILGGAAACFSASGYVGASMDDIAAASGVTKPTVYAHFGSKDALFTDLLHERLAHLDDLAPAPVTSAAQMHAALVHYAEQRVDALLADSLLGLLRAASAEAIRRPEWSAALMDSLGSSEFESWLETACDQELLRIESMADVAYLFWSQLEGALFYPVMLGMIPVPTPIERRWIVTEYVRMFLGAYEASSR